MEDGRIKQTGRSAMRQHHILFVMNTASLNPLKILVVAVVVMLSGGCAVVGGIVGGNIIGSVKAKEASENLKPFVQIVEVKVQKNTVSPIPHGAVILPAVLEANMEDQKGTIIPREKGINDTITEEILLALSVTRNTASVHPEYSLQIGTFYAENGGYTVRKQYYDISHVNKEGRAKWTEERGLGIQKVIDFRLVLKNVDTILMEARGIWGGNDKADEIAGARQLAKAIAAEVLKKLNTPASRKASIAEAKKE